MRLEGKAIIVTGGAQGAGRVYSLAVAREGAKVAVADIQDGTETVRAIQQQGGEAISLSVDVAEETSTAEIARQTHERFGRIDVLINNAAVYRGIVLKPFDQISVEEWDRLMAVNLRGLFLCAKAVVPYMKRQGNGKIVNVSSGAALWGLPGMLHYVTSKAGVIGFTRALARELGRSGIAVNTLAPGFVLNESSRLLDAQKNMPLPSLAETAIARRSIRRDLLENDLVGTVIYLSSSDSDMITGQLINIDGGATMY